MSEPAPILHARGLTYAVPGRTLLEDAGLTLRRGERHVIIGRNGAGKSTLLKVLTGELTPRAGTIDVWGRPLASYRPREIARRRAVLPQHTALNFDYQVLEVALLGRLPHLGNRAETSADLALASEALRQVGLADFESRRYLTLSGGEQQRVHLARVLTQLAGAGDDTLLFLDEPTSSLDLQHQHHVLELVSALAARGAAVLAILHDLNLAARYADAITLLAEGRVVASGPPTEVLTVPLLEAAFQHRVLVQRHPVHQCPLVISQ